MANYGHLGIFLCIVSLIHHGLPMCAPDMRGGMCKDVMLPKDLATCFTDKDKDWPCQFSPVERADNDIDFLENALRDVSAKNLLEVSAEFSDGKKLVVGCGSDKVYMQNEIGGAPYVKYPQADKNSEYLLMMVDPDAPCSDKSASYCTYLHWVVPNIPGGTLLDATRLTDVAAEVEYAPPTPPSGTHRYQLLLFEMTSGHDVHDVPDAKHRANFDLNYFIGINGLCDKLTATFQYRVAH